MSFFDRFRKRKDPPKPPVKTERMNEDWAVGDIAECINRDGWMHFVSAVKQDGPKYRERQRVIGIRQDYSPITNTKHWFLKLHGWKAEYLASDFRKVRPLHDEAECEDNAFLDKWLKIKTPKKEHT